MASAQVLPNSRKQEHLEAGKRRVCVIVLWVSRKFVVLSIICRNVLLLPNIKTNFPYIYTVCNSIL